jgi:AmmeMemoRadiSam system protein A
VNLLVALAMQAIKTYLSNATVMVAPQQLPALFYRPAAVFVTLHSSAGQLRGCRGTLEPVERSLAEAIIHTAIASAVDDPRFQPVSLPEVDDLQVKVDVLSPLEPVHDISLLDEKIYGVVIRSQKRRAVLLPDIAVVDSVPKQLALVRQKAGLQPDEPAELYRFTVTRYRADTPMERL